MADVIAFIDGFDHYTVAQGGRKYSVFPSGTSMGTGRTGSGQALTINNTSSVMEKTFSVNSQAWRVGLALRITANGASAMSLIQLKDGASAQCELVINSSRNIQINRNGTLVGSAGTTTLAQNTWYYIEWYASIKDSITSGNCQVYLNNVLELNLAGGSDIKNTTNAYANRVAITAQSSWTINIDDLVISTMDDTATPTFLGDLKVETLYPDGNGNYSDFDGSDGNSTDNYQLVDEAQNNDADYVTSDVVSDRDSYTLSNPTVVPASIKAVQITTSIRKDDAGSRVGRVFSRISGTNYESSDIALSTSFEFKSHIMETNPNTTSAWTASDLNSLEVGVKVES